MSSEWSGPPRGPPPLSTSSSTAPLLSAPLSSAPPSLLSDPSSKSTTTQSSLLAAPPMSTTPRFGSSVPFSGPPPGGPPPGPPPGFESKPRSQTLFHPLTSSTSNTISTNPQYNQQTQNSGVTVLNRPTYGNESLPFSANTTSTTPISSNVSPALPTNDQSVWTPHTTPAGKTYYYNSLTKASSWEKPEEIMTAEEKLLARSVWKEYKSDAGKTYYYNKVSKESVWVEPPELAELKRKAKESIETKSDTTSTNGTLSKDNMEVSGTSTNATSTGASPAPGFVHPSRAHLFKTTTASINPVAASNKAPTDMSSHMATQRPGTAQAALANASTQIAVVGTSATDTATTTSEVTDTLPKVIMPTPNADGFLYNTKEEAKNALKSLFLEYKIGSSGTNFDQAVKLVSHDVRWNGLRTTGEKKQCFNEYRMQRAKDEKEEEKKIERDARDNLRKFIDESTEIKPYMKWRHVEDLVDSVEGFERLSTREAMDIFDNAQRDKLGDEKESKRQTMKEFGQHYRELLNSLPITVMTTWEMALEMSKRELEKSKTSKTKVLNSDGTRVAGQMISEDTEHEDAEKSEDSIANVVDSESLLSQLEQPSFCISAIKEFESVISEREKEIEMERRREKELRRRKERRAREAYLALLKHLNKTGVIHALSTWKESFVVIGRQPAFNAMLDTTGCSAIEIFKLFISDLYDRLTADMHAIGHILKTISFEVTGDTTLQQFNKILSEDARASVIDSVNVELTFRKLIEKAQFKEKEQRKAEERELKRKLKSFAKDLRAIEPPIRSSDTWEKIRPLAEDLHSFQSITLESSREDVFNEFITEMKRNPILDEREEGEASSGGEAHVGRSRKTSSTKESSSRSIKVDGEKSREKKGKSRSRRSHSRSRSREDYSSDDEDEKNSSRHKHTSSSSHPKRHKGDDDSDRRGSSKRSRHVHSSDEDDYIRKKDRSRHKKKRKDSRRDD
eukprot:CFRG8099T1